MGSMSEEMKKVMAKWSAEEPAPEAEQAEDKTYRQRILEAIQSSPGITGVELRELMLKLYPEQTTSSVSSQVSTLYKMFCVRREVVKQPGRKFTYAYFAVPPEEAARLQKKERARKQRLVQSLEKARLAKAEKARIKQEAKDADQLALPFDAPAKAQPASAPAPTPTPAPATGPLDLRNHTTAEILNALNFKQAKDLYVELKGAFGG